VVLDVAMVNVFDEPEKLQFALDGKLRHDAVALMTDEGSVT
jgi:hypothetical protein